jgi:hypothetical protein
MYRLIESLLVAHNILETLGDDPEAIAGFNGEEDRPVRDAHRQRQVRDAAENDDTLHAAGLYRRKLLVNLMN